MPTFVVSAIDRQGKRRSLREAAPDVPSLRASLRTQALWPVKIQPADVGRAASRLVLPVADFVGFLHQLELQLRAGVNADIALGQLAADTPAGPMRAMLDQIHAEVAQGSSIHAACRLFGRQFPPHVAAVIAAGEAAAQLPEAIRSLASHLGRAEELRHTARRALIYPAMVLAATTGLVVFLVGGVVPQFAEIFRSLQVELPAITVALIATGDFLRNGWLGLSGGLLAAGFVFTVFLRAPRFRMSRDTVLLGIPLLGEIVRLVATARFAAHCRLLHEAGVPLLDSLLTGAELTGNAVMERQLLAARESVAVGRPLHAALPTRHAFPGFLVPALKSGESTGQLGAALRHIEEYASSRARERLATALALLEPVLLASLTAIVGLIALSFFLPLFSLLGGINPR